MSNMRSNEEPVVKVTKLMAELFYFMAKEMVDGMGPEKGRQAVLAAVEKFGAARVEAMQGEARERQLPASGLAAYLAVRDMPSDGWKSEPGNPLEITYCPMQDVWSQYGETGQALGYLYCQVDKVLFEGFGVKFDRPKCRTQGDDTCRFDLRKA